MSLIFSLLPETELTLKIILALLFGSLIGLERTFAKKQAGLRTFALVSLGACLFIIIALKIGEETSVESVSRVLSNIVVGIGFLGAGLIFFQQDKIVGLTTASALWVTAALGATIGLGYYRLAFLTLILTLVLLRLVGYFELKIKHEK